jgi:hypothetical protein
MRVDVQGFHGQIEQRSDQSAITCGITCERRNQKVETKSVHLAWRRGDALFFFPNITAPAPAQASSRKFFSLQGNLV